MPRRLTYRAAGVDITAGDEAVRRLRPWARGTFRKEVLGDIGAFAGFFRLPRRYRNPVLVAGTDGVGTKLRVAFLARRHDTVGTDLVAMSVNDLLVHGAEPLVFLDYIGIGRLAPRLVETIVRGIAAGCREAGCALIGGETAEMPGFYAPGEYDLAGFALGVVERDRLIDGRAVRPGDVVLGLASSGLHANGFSLARRVLLEDLGLGLRARRPGLRRSLGAELLTPTRIYVRPVLGLLRSGIPVHAMAHVTGGGLTGNLPRVLPGDCQAVIRRGAWPVPPIFGMIRDGGRIADEEMYRVFNMGIGYVCVVPAAAADRARHRLVRAGVPTFEIGAIDRGPQGVVYRVARASSARRDRSTVPSRRAEGREVKA